MYKTSVQSVPWGFLKPVDPCEYKVDWSDMENQCRMNGIISYHVRGWYLCVRVKVKGHIELKIKQNTSQAILVEIF